MTNKSWEQRYQFRLTDTPEDIEINNILENVPKNKRSEVIRNMLRFAYSAMKKQTQEQAAINELREEIKKINEAQSKYHDEIMKKLESGIMVNNAAEEQEEKITEEAVNETALSMLSSFGIDLD